MFANPMVIALTITAVLTTAFILYATGVGVHILLFWDASSSSVRQLRLERRTFLVSSVMTHAIGVQVISFVLFVYTADRLHEFFTGAMCAAGTLNTNVYGYWTLGFKLAGFIAGSLWLIIHHVNGKAPDTPLIRIQYRWLCVVCALWCSETYFLLRYFFELDPHVITSCCGTIFDANAEGFAAEMTHVSLAIIRPLFWGMLITTLLVGGFYVIRQRGDWLFALLGTLLLPVSLVALISYLCLYFYELPTHHCPFCLLQKEYLYVGYLLYGSMFIGGIAATGVGMLKCFRIYCSLQAIVPAVQKRLCRVSLAGYVVFGLIAIFPMVFSDFRLL